MIFTEFIKKHISQDTHIGDLAREIQEDENFPINKSEKEIISYLQFKTLMNNTDDVLKELLKEYKNVKPESIDDIDIEARFTLFRTEIWKYYKEYFTVNKVILAGVPSDFTKAYCIDSKSKKSLLFDLKLSPNNLNEIRIVDENNIFIGPFTSIFSVENAVISLENCNYLPSANLNKKTFNELIDFLKLNMS